MFHYAYSKKDLEQKASELIRLYDPQRVFCPKPIDVYDVIAHSRARQAVSGNAR